MNFDGLIGYKIAVNKIIRFCTGMSFIFFFRSNSIVEITYEQLSKSVYFEDVNDIQSALQREKQRYHKNQQKGKPQKVYFFHHFKLC